MKYKGCNITRVPVSGYYTAYVIDRFIVADTLRGIKTWIDNAHKEQS